MTCTPSLLHSARRRRQEYVTLVIFIFHILYQYAISMVGRLSQKTVFGRMPTIICTSHFFTVSLSAARPLDTTLQTGAIFISQEVCGSLMCVRMRRHRVCLGISIYYLLPALLLLTDSLVLLLESVVATLKSALLPLKLQFHLS